MNDATEGKGEGKGESQGDGTVEVVADGPGTPGSAGTPRGFFVRGLVVVLPAVLTIFVFVTVLQFADRYVAGPINAVIYSSLDGNTAGWRVLRWLGVDPYDQRFLLADEDLPDSILGVAAELPGVDTPEFQNALSVHRDQVLTFFPNWNSLGIDRVALRAAVQETVGIWAGIVLAACLVLSVGYLASGFLGRSAIAAFDRVLVRLPVVRAVYPHAQQIVGFFLSDKQSMEFDTVVAAPYPSEGIWSIGFVTSKGLRSVHEVAGGAMLAVYVPSSPLPMTGYMVFIEADRLVPLDLKVDEAFRMLVSAGVLVPDSETVEGLQETMERLGVSARRKDAPGVRPGESPAGSPEESPGEPTDEGPSA